MLKEFGERIVRSCLTCAGMSGNGKGESMVSRCQICKTRAPTSRAVCTTVEYIAILNAYGTVSSAQVKPTYRDGVQSVCTYICWSGGSQFQPSITASGSWCKYLL